MSGLALTPESRAPQLGTKEQGPKEEINQRKKECRKHRKVIKTSYLVCMRISQRKYIK